MAEHMLKVKICLRSGKLVDTAESRVIRPSKSSLKRKAISGTSVRCCAEWWAASKQSVSSSARSRSARSPSTGTSDS